MNKLDCKAWATLSFLCVLAGGLTFLIVMSCISLAGAVR